MPDSAPKSSRKRAPGGRAAIPTENRGGASACGTTLGRPRRFGAVLFCRGQGRGVLTGPQDTRPPWFLSPFATRHREIGSLTSSANGGGVGGQRKDFPNLLHAGDGLRAGTEAQAQRALKAAHAAGQVDQQQAVTFEPRGAFFR